MYMREEDGIVYWREEGSGDLMAAPLNVDDTTDMDNAMYVEDFDVPLSEAELAEINAELDKEESLCP